MILSCLSSRLFSRPFRAGLLATAALTALTALTVAGVSGVQAAEDSGREAAAQPVAIRFRLVAGAESVACRSAPQPLGRHQTPSRLRDARFYVQDVALVDEQGRPVPLVLDQNDWQVRNVALIDLEDGQGQCAGSAPVHSQVTGKVPPGRYQGLRLTVGVPGPAPGETGPGLNHGSTETAPPPLDISAMAWNWQAGRKFMKVEISPEGGIKRHTDTVKVWTVHLGSTDCAGNPAAGDQVKCSRANRIPLAFAGFDPDKEAVALDLTALFAQVDVARDEGGAAGCMSAPQDPECPGIFRQLGLSLEDGEPRGPVAAFRVIPDSRVAP